MNTLTVLLLTSSVAASPLRDIDFGPGHAVAARDPRNLLLSPSVLFDARQKAARLAGSVLLADETGATDYRQTEALADKAWAKEVFAIGKGRVATAELFLYGSAREVVVNGKPIGQPRKLESTGWQRLELPVEFLHEGDNDIVLKGPGQLLVEPGRPRGRSLRSADGGQTWSDVAGEFLVRLRLGQAAASGEAETPVFDLWSAAYPGIGEPLRIRGVSYEVAGQGDKVAKCAKAFIRIGPTPTPGAGWTPWLALDEGASRPLLPEWGRWRWAQVRFVLDAARPITPSRFRLGLEGDPDAGLDTTQYTVTLPSDDLARTATPGSVRFTYQAPSPRTEALRNRFQLDKVIAPGKTEMEQLILLRHWVRNQWHCAWEGGADAWMPPWDALIILDSKDQPGCLTMCTHYAAVYTQCCIALGWNARHCILDHHCVSEVYVNQHRKWVMMDAGNSKERPDCNLHFERKGVPLSARELMLVHRSGKTDNVTVCFTPPGLMAAVAPLCRPAPKPKKDWPPRPDTVPAADLPKYPVCGLANYRRYAFPPRNDYLASLLPGELYQGWSEYFHDGYVWVGDSVDDPKTSPEYSRHLDPARRQDVDWALNWSRIHLARTAKAGELAVAIETHVPNLTRVEVKEGDGEWKPAAAVWRLRPGKNVLSARGVNAFGQPGIETRVEVEWRR
jgi:hypothetical protein